MSDRFTDLPDVASRLLGAGVVHADDELFAAKENLITPEPPVHDPRAFGPRGKVYDGWETRRRRAPGNDLAIVRLGVRAGVSGVVVDTGFFVGNFPPRVSVDGIDLAGYPSVEELLGAAWQPLVPVSTVRGDSLNTFATEPRTCTHVRLTLHPDGGVARLRVHGRPVPDPALLTGTIDLAALEHGGDVVDCSDAFYASARNLLMPGRARTTGEGWENARRRDAGHDHVTVRLAGRGTVRRLVVDASCFLGNAPAEVLVRGCVGVPDGDRAPGGWVTLLGRTSLQPDTRHVLPVDTGAAGAPVDHVRLDVYPDGGLARFRVLGELAG